MKDLVQIDADTAMLLYSKGLTHLPALKRDGYSSDWTAAQPLYLDDIIEDLMIFVSDSERNKVLNPPKTDIAKVKEDIYLERRNLVSDDEDDYDDDPDWTEAKPAQVETIPDDDAVPEHDRIPYEPPKVLTVEEVTKVTEKADKPPKWNILRVNKLSNEGWTNKQIAEEYGVSEDTVRVRLIHYRSKS
ncbi:MAG: hypothetical protein IKH14_00375 [Prevotella sp.]|nr:hypothetical protein [Prevotella sp.]